MKLRTHNAERRGDHVKYTTSWTDRMKRPAHVKITLEKGNDVESTPSVLVEGDTADVNSVLYGLAEIAWANGWRPRGLIGKLAREVEQFVIPKEAP